MNTNPKNHASAAVGRRQFLGHATRTASAGVVSAGSAGFNPYFFSSVVHADEQVHRAASDQVRVGSIGVGSRGSVIMRQANQHGTVVAVADVDAARGRAAAAQLEQTRRGQAKRTSQTDVYEDYRRILDSSDIDAVTIGTTDHWHTKIAIEAMQAGKDVYCEKPLTLTIDEGKLICQVAQATGRVFQVGTQQRSEMGSRFLRGIALVRAGRLGTVHRVQCAIGGAPTSPKLPRATAPPELNWDRWLGQAPLVDYRQLSRQKSRPYSRGHYEFRWWYEYSGGKLTDWGAHHVDIATWALGLDATGPSEVKVIDQKHPTPMKDGFPTEDDRYNTAKSFHVVAKFPNVEMTIRHDTDNGILFEGTQGRIFVGRRKLTGKAVEALADNPLPDDAIRNVYKGKEPTSHMRNFFDCIKSREEPISDVFSHHRAITTCHLANIAIRLDRDLKWDPVAEAMIGDPLAQSFVKREQRKGYEIVV